MKIGTQQTLPTTTRDRLKISLPIGQHERMPLAGGDGQILLIGLGPYQRALLPDLAIFILKVLDSLLRMVQEKRVAAPRRLRMSMGTLNDRQS